MEKYFFSVIITIFDAEDYLRAAIDSIVNQSIGFKENIQLILVNNASEDNCDEICLEYKKLYPENIEYIHLAENVGPSGGRNAGMPYIKGKYFNFLDADDLWGENAFGKAKNFLLKHKEEINVLSCRRRHFGRWNGWHHTDYKFTDNDRIIDIIKEYDAIQLHVTSCFFSSMHYKDKRFDEQIGIGEDSDFVTAIILNEGKYGVLNKEVFYYYRKREDGQSALDGKEKRKSYFLNDYMRILENIISNSQKIYGKIIPFAQFQMAYETGWLLRGDCGVLNDKELCFLKEKVYEFVNKIDDNIIIASSVMHREQRAFALDIKHGSGYVSNLGLTTLKEIGLFRPVNKKNLSLKTIEIENSKLYIHCLVSVFPHRERWELYFKDTNSNKKFYPIRNCGNKSIKSLGKSIFVFYGFEFKIELQGVEKLNLKPVLKIDGNEYYTKFSCGDWVKVTPDEKASYYYKKQKDNAYSLKLNNNIIAIKTKARANVLEFKYVLALLKKKKYEAVVFRILGKVMRPLTKKKVLLISDRVHLAGDNGELFFYWLNNSVHNKGVKAYYVLNNENPDAERIRRYGRVVLYNSIKYKLLYLNAHAVISSMVDEFIYHEPFNGFNKYMLDYHKPRVCLGHGTSEQNMSKTEGKYALNLSMYTVSSKRERDSKLINQYAYKENEIKLTGTPRLDYILHARCANKKKNILFAPTWRKNLAGPYKNGKRGYNTQFKKSEYFLFFNRLINDSRILEAMKERGYKGYFNIHPAIMENSIDFEGNDIIYIKNNRECYIDQFYDNRMVITDYSSIGHDYAFAGSYVIYTQFDKSEFYRNHTYDEGSFDYEKDGFGPVCYDYESTVAQIVNTIKNDCKIEDKYIVRCEGYFEYFDGKNCERIYNEILNLNEEK